jgi:hypothetical protein
MASIPPHEAFFLARLRDHCDHCASASDVTGEAFAQARDMGRAMAHALLSHRRPKHVPLHILLDLDSVA